jgi:PAS domain S-box-containing protein
MHYNAYLTLNPKFRMRNLFVHPPKRISGIPTKRPDKPTNGFLQHQAFDNSLLANIITTVSTGEIIIANNAACKLLGYSKKELLTKNRSDIFDVHERSFIKMLKQRTADGHSAAVMQALKKNGNFLTCEITSAVFLNESGIETAITTISDMSQGILKQKNIDAKKEKIVSGNIAVAQLKSDGRLAANNEWIKYIAKASYDVMWDWDIVTGGIYVGDSIEEVFGYKIKNNTVNFTDFSACLIPEERLVVKRKLLKMLGSANKGWNDSYMFRRHDGSLASTTSRASIIRDEKGKAIRMIGAIQDISRVQELEKKLKDQIVIQKTGIKKEKISAASISLAKSKQKRIDTQKDKIIAANIILAQVKSDARLAENNELYIDKFSLASKLSFDAIWDWNLVTNDFFLGEGFEALFGYTIKSAAGNMADWSKHLHHEDKKMVEKGMRAAIASSATRWEQAYRFIRFDGSVAKVFGRASIVRDASGKAIRMIGVIHDLSRQNELEEKLEQEIGLKQKQITEAAADAKDAERSDIGKELHDNVNQLLGASRLYIDMAKQGGKDMEKYLSRSSEYTLTAIEEIRKLTRGLTSDIIKNYGLCEAIENIARDTMEVNPVKISFLGKGFMESSVNDKFKLNIFRIVQEQLNNILKYAKAKKIVITLSQNKTSVKLVISDNGIGFDTTKKQKGIGLANIKSRAASYNGKAEFVSQPGLGCILTVLFSIIIL